MGPVTSYRTAMIQKTRSPKNSTQILLKACNSYPLLCDGHCIRMKLKNYLWQKLHKLLQYKKKETANYTLSQHIRVNTVQKHQGKQIIPHTRQLMLLVFSLKIYWLTYQYMENSDQYTDLNCISQQVAHIKNSDVLCIPLRGV